MVIIMGLVVIGVVGVVGLGLGVLGGDWFRLGFGGDACLRNRLRR